MIARRPMRSRRRPPSLAETVARAAHVTPAEADKRLADARALADSWACPVCGEHGAHRCDR